MNGPSPGSRSPERQLTARQPVEVYGAGSATLSQTQTALIGSPTRSAARKTIVIRCPLAEKTCVFLVDGLPSRMLTNATVNSSTGIVKVNRLEPGRKAS